MNLGQVIGEMRMRAAGFEPDPYRKPLVQIVAAPRVTTYNKADQEPRPEVKKRRSGFLQEVEQFVRSAERPVSSSEVAAALGVTDEVASMRLLKLFRRGDLERGRMRMKGCLQVPFGYYVKAAK